MSTLAVAAFDRTIQKTNIWLKDVMDRLGWNEPEPAYRALRQVLHALRDRLPVEEAMDLGAQLPMLIRGIYYEGWTAGNSFAERNKDEFLEHVGQAFLGDSLVDVERATRAVFSVISKHVTSGEVDDIKQCLPDAIRRMWP
jgi:uncharacterized protein (DUF2267 family)